MADDLLTVSDLVADALDLSPAQVTDLSNSAPLFMNLPVTPSSNGTTHRYAKETGAPVVGFRAENAGRDFSHSADQVVSVTLRILDFSWLVDKAVADAWRRGGAAAKIAREGFRHLRAAFFAAEQQYIYGTGNAASGFAGLTDNAQFNQLSDAMVVNTTGTTANTGSSCWLIRAGEDAISGVMIENNPIDLGETVVINALDGSGNNFPAYYTPGCAWIGLQIGGAFDAVRICNLTEDSGKGLTDALIYEALSRFPGGRVPTHILCNRRSLRQLRNSRTATNATGAPAPVPREVEGIPILTLESIRSNEALVT